MKTRYFLLPGLLLSSFALTQVRPDSTGFDSTKIRSYHVVRFRGERTRLYDSLRLRGSLPLYALTDSKMLWVRATWCRWVRRDRCARYWRTVS